MSEDITIKKSTFNKLIIGIAAALIAAAFFGGYTLGTQNSPQAIIQENPQQNTAPQPTQMQPTSAAPTRVFISLDDDPIKGNPNAQLTIVEFSDFQCPFCARFYTQTLSQIQQNYIDSGKAKLVFRDFPLYNIHANARASALAAQCANEQGKFWDYHNKLFEGQTAWASLSASDAASAFKQYATDLQLNSNNFNSCLDSAKLDEINKDYQDGTNYGVTGTPTFFIGNNKDGYVVLVGAQPYSEFQKIIDAELS
jgi:protein-disulfide isomerase